MCSIQKHASFQNSEPAPRTEIEFEIRRIRKPSARGSGLFRIQQHEGKAFMIVGNAESSSEDQIQLERISGPDWALRSSLGPARAKTVLEASARRMTSISVKSRYARVQEAHRISSPTSWPDEISSGGHGRKVCERARGRRPQGRRDGWTLFGWNRREQTFRGLRQIAKAGARALRGGAFKPRSSPYSFQGMGLEGLKLLREAGDRFNLLVISEVMEIRRFRS